MLSGLEEKFTACRKVRNVLTDYQNMLQEFKVTKDVLTKLRVVQQVDNKFIIAVVKSSKKEKGVIYLFDQHAVHERILLERLLTST